MAARPGHEVILSGSLPGPPLDDDEPDDGVGQGEVCEGWDEQLALHRPSDRLLAYQAPAVRANATGSCSAGPESPRATSAMASRSSSCVSKR